MYSVKPGRGSSAMSAFGGIIAVVFGIFWTILAFWITSDLPGPIGLIFPLFGVLFVISGIGGVIYNLRNTTAEDRFSTFDVTTAEEESDPLNEMFGAQKNLISQEDDSVEGKLKELDHLRDKGLITDTEYASQRQRILNTI